MTHKDRGRVGGRLSEKGCIQFIQHETAFISLQEDHWLQGQMDNTCFATADSEIESMFECTEMAIKQSSVLEQLLRVRQLRV